MENLLKEAQEALLKAQDKTQLQEVYNLYLSKKGKVAALMAQMKDLSPLEKPKFGDSLQTPDYEFD